jgi:hypothetical protein
MVIREGNSEKRMAEHKSNDIDKLNNRITRQHNGKTLDS